MRPTIIPAEMTSSASRPPEGYHALIERLAHQIADRAEQRLATRTWAQVGMEEYDCTQRAAELLRDRGYVTPTYEGGFIHAERPG
jgi:hypothetical protein